MKIRSFVALLALVASFLFGGCQKVCPSGQFFNADTRECQYR
jgi:hypothetical protein